MQCDHRSESCFNFLTLGYFTGDLTEAGFSQRGLNEQHWVSPAPSTVTFGGRKPSSYHILTFPAAQNFTVHCRGGGAFDISLGVFEPVIWVSSVFIMRYRQAVFHILFYFFSLFIHDCCSFAYTQIFLRRCNQSYFEWNYWSFW